MSINPDFLLAFRFSLSPHIMTLPYWHVSNKPPLTPLSVDESFCLLIYSSVEVIDPVESKALGREFLTISNMIKLDYKFTSTRDGISLVPPPSSLIPHKSRRLSHLPDAGTKVPSFVLGPIPGSCLS